MKTSNEYKSFQQQCLHREFKDRHNDSIKFEKEIKSLLDNLQSTMSYDDFNKLQNYLYDRSKRIKELTTLKHEKKLTKLNKGPVGQNYQALKTKLVHNLSSHVLSPSEERILNRGWEFCIETKLTNVINLKTDLKINMKKLEPTCHNNTFKTICREVNNHSTRLINLATNKKIRNISDDEFKALTTLRKNPNIIICKADKGNCIVILDKDDYIKKADDILNQKQFVDTNKSLLGEKEKQLNKYILQLLNEKIIEKQLYWRLQSTSSSIATMYGQPKVHKPNYPLRPIISCVGAYNHELAKYLADIITKNRPDKSFSFIKDSFQFVRRITEMTESKRQTMISFDVDNLYTNVPVNEAIEITLDMLFKRPSPPPILFNREQLRRLLEIAVCNTPFRFLDRTFLQCDGVAMGSPLGPILADVFMSNLEKRLNRFTTNKPIIWIRYVDDIFCIFKEHQNIDEFFRRINKWHKNIKLTKESETGGTLAFLDVLVIRDDVKDKYITTLYRKPTNTNLYLLYESNQCRRYKIGLIRTLAIRILLICSTTEHKERQLKLLKETLVNNGYPQHLIRRGIREGEAVAQRINNNIQNQQQNTPTKKKEIFLTLSYYGNESAEFTKKLKKTCKKYLPLIQINIAFKKTTTIKRLFLPIQKGQDSSKKEKKVVYKISCKDCDNLYIGETCREKSVRMKEHQKDIRNFSDKSHIAKHVIDHKHSFDFAAVETLTNESNWTRRVIKESLYTSETQGRALNDVKFKLNIFS